VFVVYLRRESLYTKNPVGSFGGVPDPDGMVESVFHGDNTVEVSHLFCFFCFFFVFFFSFCGTALVGPESAEPKIVAGRPSTMGANPPAHSIKFQWCLFLV
jgi:hypothetical protein